MTYSTTITNQSQRHRAILKIAGVDRYFTTWLAASWDDTAYGNTHGSLTIEPTIIKSTVSPGSVNHQEWSEGPTTVGVDLQATTAMNSYMGRRAAKQYCVNDPLTAAATSLTVGDEDDFTIGSYYHINKECFKVTAKPGSNVLTIARGQLGTTAAKQPVGSEISPNPLHWIGRKAWIVFGALNGGTWEYQDPWVTCFVEQTPKFQDGQWRISLSNGLSYFDRPLYQGFTTSDVKEVLHASSVGSFNEYIRLTVDTDKFLESGNTTKQKLAVLLECGDEKGVFIPTSITSTSITFAPHTKNAIGRARLRRWLSRTMEATTVSANPTGTMRVSASVVFPTNMTLPLSGVTARPVYPMVGGLSGESDAADIALRAMLSVEGDETNHATYDLLPGEDLTETEVQTRAGAGLLSAEVDVAAWQAVKNNTIPTKGFILGLEEGLTLMTLLTRDIAPAVEGYVRITRAGQLSIKQYKPATVATSTSFVVNADSKLSGNNFVDDESSIVSKIEIGADFDWAVNEFRRKHVLNIMRHHRLYGDTSNKLEVQSRIFGDTYHDILSCFDQYLGRWGEGAQRFSVEVPWTGHLVEPGDTVLYTNAQVPNGLNGTLGIENLVCEVVSAGVNIQSKTVALELVRRPTCDLVSLSAEVDVVNGAGDYDIDPLYAPSGYDMTDEWVVGWPVIFIDPSGSTATQRTAGATTGTIATVSANNVTVTSGPTNVAAGDIMLLANWADATQTTTNTASGATPRDHTYIDTGINPANSKDTWG